MKNVVLFPSPAARRRRLRALIFPLLLLPWVPPAETARAQSAAPPAQPPSAPAPNAPDTQPQTAPTSELAGIRLPIGVARVTEEGLVSDSNFLLKAVADHFKRQTVGTEVWIWSGRDYKADEAIDIMQSAARKLKLADYTYKEGKSNQAAASTIVLFTAATDTRTLLGAWRIAPESLSLSWCELQPATGDGANAPAGTTSNNSTPGDGAGGGNGGAGGGGGNASGNNGNASGGGNGAAGGPTAPAAQPAGNNGDSGPPAHDTGFFLVSRITGLTMPMGANRIENEPTVKKLGQMLQGVVGDSGTVGAVEAMGWRGPAIDADTAKSTERELTQALQKGGYSYQEAEPKKNGDLTYTYFTAKGAKRSVQGMWRLAEQSLMLGWAELKPPGGAAADGVASTLAAVALPNGAERVDQEALVGVLTRMLQKAAAPQTVRDPEVFAWKGDTYKPEQTADIMQAVMQRLATAGFQPLPAVTPPDPAAPVSYFTVKSDTRSLQGLWRKSDKMLLLAWGVLAAGQ